ncbi:MAG: hypothetical protein PHD23_07875 [Eubacteriales bacterium]|nr:hypothetical protein [Eubacteriales bacterium]
MTSCDPGQAPGNNNIIRRWYAFTGFSVFINVLLSVGKVIIGLSYGSWFLGVSALYNLGLSYAKGSVLLRHTERTKFLMNDLSVGAALMIAGLADLILKWSQFNSPDAEQREVHLIYALALAAITFFEIGMNVYGYRFARRHNHQSMVITRKINLCSAFVSLGVAQQAIISMRHGTAYANLKTMPMAMIISLIVIIVGYRMIRQSRIISSNVSSAEFPVSDCEVDEHCCVDYGSGEEYCE